MEKQITGKEIRKNMEYLLMLLHTEWERSGKTKAQVTVNLSDAEEVKRRMTGMIAEKQKQLEMNDLTFEQSMELAKQDFVLIRLVKKVKKAEEKTAEKADDAEFSVELEREEYELFAEIAGIQEE